MKNLLTLVFILITATVMAQTLPQKSPGASVKQTIGLTDVEVVYSRPSAKDRKVFGELVPYNENWRTGANKATAITFAGDVNFGGKEVKAGTYSIFTIPSENEWTIILNSETELWGTNGYKEANDVVRIKMPAKKCEFEETFTIGFNNLTESSANLFFKWERTVVNVKITVDAEAAAWANIESKIQEVEGSWSAYTRAADYAVRTGKNLDQALEWTNKSLAMNDSWWTLWVQAQVYAAKGDYKSAKKSLKRSIELGNKEENWGYGDTLNKLMEEYNSK